MKIDISSIRNRQGVSISVQFVTRLEDLVDEGNVVRFKEPVKVTGSVVNIDQHFLLTGSAIGQVELICDRCMESFVIPIEAELQYSFADACGFRGHVARVAGEGEPDADPDIREFAGDEIDITDEVREAVLLALPSKRLCSVQCKGICPVCGVNRNKSECKCAEDSVDPRLADLASLYRQLGGGETVGKSKG
ncbi:MAG: DUF177 domain-containing protein [Bacillota bacterium]